MLQNKDEAAIVLSIKPGKGHFSTLLSHSIACIEVTVQSLGSSSCKSVEDVLSEDIYETWHFVAHQKMTRKSEWLGN